MNGTSAEETRQSLLSRLWRWTRVPAMSLAAILLLELTARVYTYKFGRDPLFQADPVLGWRLSRHCRPFEDGSTIQVNEDGIVGEDVPPKEPGELRVLCMGDSITFGTSFEGLTFPHYLEQALARWSPDRKWRVINAGIPGYTTWQGLALLDELAPRYNPDLLVVTFLIEEMGTHPYRGSPPETPGLRVQRILYHSALYLLALQAIKGTSPIHDPVPVDGGSVRPETAYGMNLDVFADKARQMGIPIVFVEEALNFPPPGRRETGAPALSPETYRQLCDVLEEHTEAKHLPLVRISHDPEFLRLGSRFYFPHDTIHPSTPGNEIIGEAIATEIVARQLLSH